MIERILDFITSFWRTLMPWVVVDDTEAGVLLRLGRFQRVISPGLNWKYPLFDAPLVTSTVITTMALRAQTLTTKDDLTIVVAAIVKYHITDVRSYLLDVWDSADVLNDVTMGAIREVVATSDYQYLHEHMIEEDTLQLVKKETQKFGVEVLNITFSDLGKVKSFRLISDNHDLK
jgi:membrane protease subunit HflK